MKFLGTLLSLFALLAQAAAATTLADPVILIYQDTADFNAGKNAGIIGLIIDSRENARVGSNANRLRKALDGHDPHVGAEKALGCIGLAQTDQGCRTVYTYVGAESGLPSFLREKAIHSALVVEIAQQLSDLGYWARASVSEVVLDKDRLAIGRRFTAGYKTGTPAEVLSKASANPMSLLSYWTDGSPSRLEAETSQSFGELRELLSELLVTMPAEGGVPKEWKDLPEAKSLRDAGRANCPRLSCSGTRVLRDTPTRFWVVAERPIGREIGTAMASVDPNAALQHISMYGFVVSPQ